MSEWTAAQLRELVREMICAERRHRDVLRTDDRRWIEDALEEKDKALKLQASSFPTTLDFNILKSQVEVVIALFKVVTGLAAVVGVIAAILYYTK